MVFRRLRALLWGERAVGSVIVSEKDPDLPSLDPRPVVISCQLSTGDSALIVGKVIVSPRCIRGSCTEVSWNKSAIILLLLEENKGI